MSTILLSVDAIRADHLTQYGYHRNTMPVLEEWLSDAHKFTNVFSNGPYTIEAIPSLLASQYVHSDELRNGPNLASVLSDEGVRTAGFHSNTAISSQYDRIYGFDIYKDFTGELDDTNDEYTVPSTLPKRAYQRLVETLSPAVRVTEYSRSFAKRIHESLPEQFAQHEFTAYVGAEQFTNELIKWLRKNADEEFCLWAHYMDPHRPYGLHPETPEFANRSPSRGEIRSLMPKAGQNPDTLTSEEWDQLVDLYDSDLRYLSDHIDRLFTALRDLGIWEDTNIVFTSDHGEEFGEHGHAFHRNRPYDELLHVPMLIKTIDGTNRTHREIRELVDVAPTICEFHGVEYADFVGTNLFESREKVAISKGSRVENGTSIGVRSDTYKYIYTETDNGEYETELYNLLEDPGEHRQVDDPETTKELYSRIPDALLNSYDPTEYGANTAAARQRLAQLGYLDDE